jgi:glycosyltransferase involved in cell wall biosynthesis
MKVAAYLQLARTLQPTGVGKHMNLMVAGLARRADVQLTVLAGRDQVTGNGTYNPAHELRELPLRVLPWSRGMTERLWRLLKRPKIERWSEGADWIYCPTEAYIPSKRTPVAVTVHASYGFERDLPFAETFTNPAERWRWMTIMRPMLREARLVLVVSEFLKRRLEYLLNVDPNRMVVVGNGVEDVYFEAGDAPEPSKESRPVPGPYVMHVGGMGPIKGSEYVFKVAELLAELGSPIQIVAAGKNPPESTARAKTLSNIVELGYVSAGDLSKMMRQAVAVLCLSRYESFGIPVFEAMAAGTAVISSKYGALPEAVGNAGIIVDVERPAEVVDWILQLERSEALRMTYISRGRQRAQNFRWSNCVSRLHEALLRFS